MNNQNDRGGNILISAIVGGLAGALVVYLSDEKRRKRIKGKIDDFMEEGQERVDEFRESLKDSMKRGKKNIAKKLREAEEKLES